jgi:SAM-dependent methyltransferase
MLNIRKRLKSSLPRATVELLDRLRLQVLRHRNKSHPLRAVFEGIYERGDWGHSETGFSSGSGSDHAVANSYIEFLKSFIADHNREVKTVVDVGCGDFRVGAGIVSPVIKYIGIDVVRPLIADLQRRYAFPHVEFHCLDAVDDPLPTADLYLVRQVFQHLSNSQIQKILNKLGGARYILVTEHLPAPEHMLRPNVDKPHGGDIRIYDDSGVFLDRPPFSVPNLETVLEVDVPKPMRWHGEKVRTWLIRASRDRSPAH